MQDSQPVKVALVHDWLNQAGGAEVVLTVLHEMFPSAPIITTIHDPARVPTAGWDIRTSWMDRLPAVHRRHQPYLPLYPFAWETTRLHGYDLVLSNKSGFCHGVHTGGAVHVCYCLTPTRYVWELDSYLDGEDLSAGARLALKALLPLFKHWDRAAADRVDHFIAISSTVRDRIAAFYQRTSTVIYPPAELGDYRPAETTGDDYLVLARLVPYKRIDVAIEAFNRLGRPLVIIGDGRDRARLEALAGPTVSFRGRLGQAEVASLLARCRGLVWPGVEDYGLVPVEAMAAGRPVIARRAGGVLDTVVDGVTGVFFDGAEPDALAAAVCRADTIAWDRAAIHAHAAQFGRATFETRLRSFLAETLAQAPRRVAA
jgi:glycosyltransferase involved in cell wall biosynthesis